MHRTAFELKPARPYSLSETVARLVRFTTLVDRWTEDGEYSRCLFLDDALTLIAVRQSGTPARAMLHVSLLSEKAATPAALEQAEAFVRRSLGAACDLKSFYRSLRDDELLAESIRAHHGMALCGGASFFEAIVTTVLAQQVNLKFAYSIYDALTSRYGERLKVDGEERIAFPTAARISRVRDATLRNFKLTGGKAGAIALIAKAIAKGELDAAQLAELSDEEVILRLVAYKGIGRWTAETAMIRGLGRIDVFPAGDLGVVKKIAMDMLGRTEVAREDEMREFSERWRPYRSLALIYAYASMYNS